MAYINIIMNKNLEHLPFSLSGSDFQSTCLRLAKYWLLSTQHPLFGYHTSSLLKGTWNIWPKSSGLFFWPHVWQLLRPKWRTKGLIGRQSENAKTCSYEMWSIPLPFYSFDKGLDFSLSVASTITENEQAHQQRWYTASKLGRPCSNVKQLRIGLTAAPY